MSYKRSMRRSGVILLVASLFLGACGSDTAEEGEGDPTQDPTATGPDEEGTDSTSEVEQSEPAESVGSLDVGMTVPSADLMLPVLADELGCFASEGLEVETFVFGGGPDGARALLNGDIDILSSAPTSPAVAQDSGQDQVVFYGGNTSQFSWWADPETESLEGINGGSVIVNPLGSTPHLLTAYMLDELTEYGSDGVDYVPVSGPGARLSSLLAGQANAAILAQAESYEAEDEGFVQVATLDDLPAAVPNSYNSMRSLLDERPEAVEAFIAGIECASDAWDSDVDSVVPIVSEFSGQSPEIAERLVTDSTGRDPECGEIREEDAQLVIDMLQESGDITGDLQPDDFIDDRFIGC